MATVSRLVEPVRLGVTYEPPVFAMEFRGAEEDGVLQVSLPMTKRLDADVDEIFEGLLASYSHYLNVATVSLTQVRRLVQMLVDHHSKNTKSAEGEPEGDDTATTPKITTEHDRIASRFRSAVVAMKQQMLKSSYVKHIDATKKLHPDAPRHYASCLP